MPRNNKSSRNNNPSGRNQYSSDWMDTVKERPFTAAATAAAAVGAGVFLWSKRTQLSEQMNNLSDQISEWRDSMRSSDDGSELSFDENSSKPASRRSNRKTQQEISEEALSLKETGAA